MFKDVGVSILGGFAWLWGWIEGAVNFSLEFFTWLLWDVFAETAVSRFTWMACGFIGCACLIYFYQTDQFWLTVMSLWLLGQAWVHQVRVERWSDRKYG